MRFAVKVVSLGVLGLAAALLVACGDRSHLLSGAQASSLQDAIGSVQSACAAGRSAQAAQAAQTFSDRVAALPPGSVDRRLIANLQQGAATLDALVARTCTGTTTPTTTTGTTTTPTTTTGTTTTPTTTTGTTTTPTVTTPTTPTTPTAPDNGGTTTTSPTGPPGGVPPGQAKKGNGGAGAPGATP